MTSTLGENWSFPDSTYKVSWFPNLVRSLPITWKARSVFESIQVATARLFQPTPISGIWFETLESNGRWLTPAAAVFWRET